MSRMFNVLSGGAAARAGGPEPMVSRGSPARAAAAADPAVLDEEEFIPAVADAPYVEIGGPGGPVFSAGPAVVKLPTPRPAEPLPASRAATAPAPVEARSFPRLAGDPAFLSVTFHDLSGRTRANPDIEGPDPGLVALHRPDHAISGEYRTLRDEVRAQLPDPTPRVLLFTAAAGEAGTTSVLLNLAITIAREAAPRVLVVDANATRPAAARRLALKPGPGLVEVLAQQVPLAWAVQGSAVPNLQVLPAGGAGGVAIGPELPKLIEQLRQWYDWVLIDGGVLGINPDRDAACPAADAVYLVSREADADRSEFAGLRGWVKELGGLLRGYVTTRA